MHWVTRLWGLAGLLGYGLLPWYMLEDGLWQLDWLFDGYPFDSDYAPAIFQWLSDDRWWLAPVGILLIASVVIAERADSPRAWRQLQLCAALGLLFLIAQGAAIGIRGWNFQGLNELFGSLDRRQYGMGSGAALTAFSLLFLYTRALAAQGRVRGDYFVVSAIALLIALISTFVAWPVLKVLISAFQDSDQAFSAVAFGEKFFDDKLWGLSCLAGGNRCGVAWNSLFLAISVGIGSTALGLAFALLITRSPLPARRALRLLSVLPIITPPFVIGLAIILLFGRAGSVTQFFATLLDIEATRWIYGLPGVWFAQTLAFTPIAFMVIIGVIEGISPSMEEASQTLRASPWQTFQTVTFPLLRPGLANAFLISFIESLADFGNPLVLGGNFDVLSTEIFFSVVGAQSDQGRAAVLALVLLSFTLGAFFVQRRWLGNRAYTTVTGKGDAGLPAPLPTGVKWAAYCTALPWAAITLTMYVMIIFGGFVKTWGYDHTFTLQHYVQAFQVSMTEHGVVWGGSAWNSFWTTVSIAAISAPLTAAMGLLTAWLLVRQNFVGKNLFEFGTMLSFAIPGTVIGVSYVLAFNVPPLELTGTGAILVICFVFRNMPVGVRAGIAAMSQLDKHLDEASLTLRANSFATLRNVVLPLLRPAIVAALTYSFVTAMTAVSAVIFLVSANYDMSTSYIIGRVENGDYGIAIAYSSALIVVMLVAIFIIQKLVGQRRLGRRQRGQAEQLEPAQEKA